ncbi:conserved hypothetical protein [Leptothrix cholodnii SP-6]|uniref:CorA-like Mg2+ transporter protein n=1 Tax=Leptothrix cholodnii (strain ATCC 51168 / LMG 8142 / SP-6) TaxID=395495 RepID=B1Y5S8_LEPCP|nr:hypothetical protein [Leptothrix cholodnii]ACB35974.1 conserved hypothetical protein [Leptothrix cholodnii SP-6]
MTLVRQFRQSLLWPLQLMPREGVADPLRPWKHLLHAMPGSPWREVIDEYTGDPEDFHERHYNEFVTFLPYVQRFLYGEGAERGAGGRTGGASSMHVLRRHDVARVRLQLTEAAEPIELKVEHVDLYFFYDVDVIALNVEVSARDLPLNVAQEVLYRFGRGYPPGWDAQGRGLHCPADAMWIGHQGEVLARTDANQRDAFLSYVATHRAPRLAAHWRWLLEPLVPDQADLPGALRYRQIEFHRMPVTAYLALDDPRELSRADFVRLGLVSGQGVVAPAAEQAVGTGPAPGIGLPPGLPAGLPYASEHLSDFEARYCYDRFWCSAGVAPHTRYMCCGPALVVVGSAKSTFFVDLERGVLAQFRHQQFLLFLIAHFQKAALLMFSDRMVVALDQLAIDDAGSVKRFKRAVRGNFENFLRFTHRYWFHEISEQAQTRELFRLCANHLELDTLYAEVRQRVTEMNSYLDTDSLRRQANTVVRLTVVTIAGLIGALTTGLLGMNLLAMDEAPLPQRLLVFGLTAFGAVALTVFTVAKSKSLSDFLDALSDERVSWRRKAGAFLAVFRKDVH